MATPAQNDLLLRRWISDEVRARIYEDKVSEEQKGPSNLPIPAADPNDVTAARQFRQSANLDARQFLELNGVIRGYGRHGLSSSGEFQRLLLQARGQGAPAAIVSELSKAVDLAKARETGGGGGGIVTATPGGGGAASATTTSTLGGVVMLAALTSPAWLAFLFVKSRRR